MKGDNNDLVSARSIYIDIWNNKNVFFSLWRVCSVMGIIFHLFASLFVLSLFLLFVSKVHYALCFSLCFNNGIFVVHMMSCKWGCSCPCWCFADVFSWAAAASSSPHSCIINNLLRLLFTGGNERRRNAMKLASALPNVRLHRERKCFFSLIWEHLVTFNGEAPWDKLTPNTH